eukprot:CAMPEP_0174706976 /NCGR_PEP_ID=MMETSP1094-20130205/9637_1 /TAXON_ID=156173 /ORGANISM="Chrysochromulina brevifilum, Strain UTEX LB 985" /LENGTH=99 /DNA_ID=CAMNT_0015905309 /DNA_START=107 /DNA_END=403 /DNA_ORIENTATION=+
MPGSYSQQISTNSVNARVCTPECTTGPAKRIRHAGGTVGDWGHSTAEFRPPRAPTSPPVASSSPQSPSPTPDGPRQLERGGRAAALRAAGGAQRVARTP